jgi:Rps23 Pro-64 3,4-dihydroxylase Tpa1-like proline 4-hydroxylase
MIKIIDNCLPENLLIECIKRAELSKNYSVLHSAGGSGSHYFKYNWMFCSVTDNGIIEDKEIKNLWGEVQKCLPTNIRLHRGYVNAHTYGVEDTIHIDDPEIKNGLTVIVYLCNDWYPEWFGQTMFFNLSDKHNNEIIQSVLPRFNRILIFDKNILHCVSPLSRRFTGIRLTCMFKVELLDESA